MGLTLHHTLRAPAVTTENGARKLVAAMRKIALEMHRSGRVQAVGPIRTSPRALTWCSEWLMAKVPGDPHTIRGIQVPAIAGFVITVTLGEDCEPLHLGLCRYPTHVKDPLTGRLRAVRRRGWRLSAHCKTQYASLHGWEHFRRCHVAAVDLLSAVASLGVRVEVTDEGGYWPDRDEAALRESVQRMNGIVAAFAGALKDAIEDVGGAPVQSPIFAHPQFERIEAEGIVRDGRHVREAVTLTRRTKPPST